MKRAHLISFLFLLNASVLAGCLEPAGGVTGTAGSGGPGTAGTMGAAGSNGSSGTTGSAGDQGTAGVQGTAGTGSTGIAGDNGTAGTTGGGGSGAGSGDGGTTGYAGRGGTTGAAGTSGAAGTTGRGGAAGGTAGSSAGGRGGGGGAAGTTGAGGTGVNDAMAVGSFFDGQGWVLRCGPTQSGERVCTNNQMLLTTNTLSHDNPLGGRVNRNDNAVAPGTAGQPYCITIKVQGVTEAKNYSNDTVTNRSGTPYGVTGNISFGNTTDANITDGTNGWAVGGMPTAGNDYNVYAILVDSPRQIFYLNSVNTNSSQNNRLGHASYQLNYTASFNINGGSRVQFLAADFNGNSIRNCAEPIVEGQCTPITVANLPAVKTPANVNIVQPLNGQFVVTSLVAARAGACTCTNSATCQ